MCGSNGSSHVVFFVPLRFVLGRIYANTIRCAKGELAGEINTLMPFKTRR